MIDVLSAFDANYAKYWYAQVLQIIVKAKEPVAFHIIAKKQVLDSLHTDRLVEAIHMLGIRQDATFCLYDVDECIGKSKHRIAMRMDDANMQWISEPTYYRLYASEVLQCDRCIYLDVDVLVRCDLSELMHMDMHGNEVAMGANYLKSTGLNHKYFCAGIAIMDLQRMRADNCVSKFEDASNTLELREHDQTILNNVCTIHELPFEYACSQYRWWCNGDEPIVKHPKLVHFITSRKPWKNSKVVVRKFFDEWWAHYNTITGMMQMLALDLF